MASRLPCRRVVARPTERITLRDWAAVCLCGDNLPRAPIDAQYGYEASEISPECPASPEIQPAQRRARRVSLIKNLETDSNGAIEPLDSHNYPIWTPWIVTTILCAIPGTEVRLRRRSSTVHDPKLARLLRAARKNKRRPEGFDFTISSPFVRERSASVRSTFRLRSERPSIPGAVTLGGRRHLAPYDEQSQLLCR